MTPPSATVAGLVDALDRTDRGVTFVGEGRMSFAQLRTAAREIAHGLVAAGLRRGDRLLLVLPAPSDFVPAFLGAIRAGVVPVPVYPPRGLSALAGYVEDLGRIARVAGARGTLAIPALRALLEPLGPMLVLADCRGRRTGALPEARPDETAFLQFTSGSTAAPKGVIVTHRGLLAAARVVSAHMKADGERDRAVSWLPTFHDMGLIGFVVAPLVEQVSVSYMQPLAFARRPQAWCELMTQVRGTIAFAPSFAYALVVRRATAADVRRWDLSSWRVVGCGAEAIDPAALHAFTESLAPAGLDPRAVLPCYGLAEATLAVALSPLGRGMVCSGGVVSCGPAAAGHELEVVDPHGQPVPDGVEGEIIFRGPSVAAGYAGDDAATAHTFRADGLHTADLGFLAGGELHVTGRLRDLIVIRGCNFHPQDIERCAAEVAGVRPDGAVAFARPAAGGGDELAMVLEARPDADESAIRAAVRRSVGAAFGLAVADIAISPARTLPRTTSGKLRRAETRARYLELTASMVTRVRAEDKTAPGA